MKSTLTPFLPWVGKEDREGKTPNTVWCCQLSYHWGWLRLGKLKEPVQTQPQSYSMSGVRELGHLYTNSHQSFIEAASKWHLEVNSIGRAHTASITDLPDWQKWKRVTTLSADRICSHRRAHILLGGVVTTAALENKSAFRGVVIRCSHSRTQQFHS